MIKDNIAAAMDFLWRRKRAYQAVFLNEEDDRGQIVLRDLARYCKAHENSFHQDPHVRAMLEGRRQVFLRISHHLRLTDDQLWQLYDGRELK